MSSSPAWLDALTPRGGPLVSAARRFLETHAGAPPSPDARGAEGLRTLAKAVDAWAERDDEPTDADEESFIEGAGALLACFVLDHFPNAVHASKDTAHRVRIGSYGFFDPFSAVERALDGPSARAVLVEELSHAEDEAAARTGLGRGLALLEQRLAALRPELTIREVFEQHVVLSDGIELDLSRVLLATEGQDTRAVTLAIDKLIAMLPGSPQATELESTPDELLPRLVPTEFLQDSPSTRSELVLAPVFGGALFAALLLGYEGRARYVRTRELSAWSLTPGDALALALQNLAARSARARFARIDTPHGPLVFARTGDGLDAARLLLPTLHEVLAPELGSPFLAAAPHRDVLFACALEPRELRESLLARVREDAARAPHRISEQLFRVAPDGVRPWSE